MATYQVLPDYQSFLTAPYQQPTQAIVQAVATRNAYWDLGASQLKNSYENYLGMSLTRADNKQTLNGLMKDVNENVKRSVKSDLSIMSNVGEAMKSFDPITNNQNIMGDNAITSHYNTELQKALSLRNKGDGSEYNDTNVTWLMQGLDKFRNDAKPESWRDHYATRRLYVPYYDVSKEVRELLKNFKPNQTSSTSPDIDQKTGAYKSMYLKSFTDKSWYETQLNGYISSNLSDKAKKQLAINGQVAFYNNPDVLYNEYKSENKTRLSILNGRVSQLKGHIAGTTDQDLKQSYNDELTNIQNQIEDLKNEDGNQDFFNRNKDAVAASIYTNKFVKNLAAGNQRDDLDVSFKPDAAAIKYFSEDQENRRFNKRLDFEKEQNELNRNVRFQIAMLKGAGASATGLPESIAREKTADESSNVDYGVEYLRNQVTVFKDELDRKLNSLNGFIEGIERQKRGDNNFKLGNLPKLERDSLFLQFVDEGKQKGDRLVLDYMQAFQAWNNANGLKSEILKEASDKAKAANPELFNPSPSYVSVYDLKNKSTVPILISKEDKLAAVSGKPSEVQTIAEKIPGLGASTVGPGATVPGAGYLYYVNYKGKKYPINYYEYLDLNKELNGSKLTEAINSQVSAAITKGGKENVFTDVEGKAYKNLQALVGAQFNLPTTSKVNLTSYDDKYLYFTIPEATKGVDGAIFDKLIRDKGGVTLDRGGFKVFAAPWSMGLGGPKVIYDPALSPVQDYFNMHSYDKSSGYFTTPAQYNYDPNMIGEPFGFYMIKEGPTMRFYPLHKQTGISIKGPNGEGFDSLQEAAAFLKNTFTTKETIKNLK